MRVCLWDLSEGRSEVVDSVWTGSVGFCQCSTLETSPGNFLLAFAGEQTEEVRHQEGKLCRCGCDCECVVKTNAGQVKGKHLPTLQDLLFSVGFYSSMLTSHVFNNI